MQRDARTAGLAGRIVAPKCRLTALRPEERLFNAQSFKLCKGPYPRIAAVLPTCSEGRESNQSAADNSLPDSCWQSLPYRSLSLPLICVRAMRSA